MIGGGGCTGELTARTLVTFVMIGGGGCTGELAARTLVTFVMIGGGGCTGELAARTLVDQTPLPKKYTHVFLFCFFTTSSNGARGEVYLKNKNHLQSIKS